MPGYADTIKKLRMPPTGNVAEDHAAGELAGPPEADPDVNDAFEAPKTDVVVAKGDTMWGIAQKLLGDGRKWELIAKANPQIKDPNLIHPGMKLNLPAEDVADVAPPRTPLPPAPITDEDADNLDASLGADLGPAAKKKSTPEEDLDLSAFLNKSKKK